MVGAIAGADGKWALNGLACRAVQFKAYRAGFITGPYGAHGPVLDPASLEGVLLTSGAPTHDLKIQLLPEAVITGKVLDEAGLALTGTSVMVLQTVVSEGRRELQSLTGGTADSLGQYRIWGLRSGNYVVCARTEQQTYPRAGGKPMPYGARCYPETPASATPSTIPLEAGRELQVDFNFAPLPAFTIRGFVGGLPQSVWHPSPNSIGVPSIWLRKDGHGESSWAPVVPNISEGKFEFVGVAQVLTGWTARSGQMVRRSMLRRRSM